MVNLPALFLPPRRGGLAFQIGASLVLMAAGGLLLWQAFLLQSGLLFLAEVAAALALLAPVPLLLYRAYSLLSGRYVLERDGLRLRWGLRVEEIPLPQVEWVRPAYDMPGRGKSLPYPWLHWPGSLVGTRQAADLGPVEYLASDPRPLVLVATRERIYAVSPADPEGFIRAFHRVNELGSLSPLPARSVYPTFLLARVWADRLARALVLSAFVLGILLLIWVALVIPTQVGISLGFTPAGEAVEPGPPERLLLLPILNGLSFFAALLAGLFFYRRSETQIIAYLLWAGSAFMGLLLLISMFYLT